VLVLAGTDGVLRGLDPQSGEQRWTNDVGAEIVGTPAVVDEHIIFGTGNGAVLAVSLAGEVVWRANVGEHGAVPIDIDLDLDGKVETDQVIAAPVYGAPLVTDGVVYIGDNTGQMHALKLLDGERVWTFARADYAIEHAPVIWDDLVIFGAWDGYLYAVKRHDGTLAWKSAGPKSSEGRGVRYYAPADCRPVVIGDRLYVTDRGYVLGAYNRAGDLVEKVAENVSAIVPAPQGGFFARYLNDHVGYFDAYGKEVWKTAADAGRFPMPPTPVGDGVFVCSDRGLVTQFDGAGAIRNQYQATPGFYVMAPLTATEDGLVIVTGMDGSVTALRAARPIATR
jgi:outer membrane protein assembly factor BamB